MTKNGNHTSNYNYAVPQKTPPQFLNNNTTKINTQVLKNSNSNSNFGTPQSKYNN
jgi:hypothetical protein